MERMNRELLDMKEQLRQAREQADAAARLGEGAERGCGPASGCGHGRNSSRQ